MKKDDFWRKAASIEMGIHGALIFIGILGIIKGSFLNVGGIAAIIALLTADFAVIRKKHLQ